MINIGIIGAGRIGKVHLESITYHVKNARVKSVAEPYLNVETKAFIESMGVTEIYTDYKQILADPEIDAVLICSSTDTHASISMEAIEAGKHIFCEKPIDQSIEKIEAVKTALEGKNLKYQVGFNRRFDHNFAAVRAAVNAGRIGDPHIIKITSRDPAPPNPAYIKVSGGIFMDMAIHDFDMACFLAGSDVEEVYVAATVLVDPAIGEQGDFDTAIITLKMANGALCVIDNSRRAAYGYDQRAEVFGNKGSVASANDTLSSAVISDENGVTGEKPLYFFLERYMQSYTTEMLDFVDAIVNDKDVPCGIDAGLQSVKIALAAKKSALENRPVKLCEI